MQIRLQRTRMNWLDEANGRGRSTGMMRTLQRCSARLERAGLILQPAPFIKMVEEAWKEAPQRWQKIEELMHIISCSQEKGASLIFSYCTSSVNMRLSGLYIARACGAFNALL